MTAVKHMARRKPGIAGDGPGAAPAQQPAAGAVPTPAPAAVVAGNRPGPGSRTAAPDLAAVHAGGRLGPGSAPPRNGQDPPLAGIAPGGHVAAALGGIRLGGIPGSSWAELPLAWFCENGEKAACDAGDLSAGLLMLACGDVAAPAWPGC